MCVCDMHTRDFIEFLLYLQLYVDQKFHVLGSQSMVDLRDKIACVNDLAVAGDFSENPDECRGYYAKVSTLTVQFKIVIHFSSKLVYY